MGKGEPPAFRGFQPSLTVFFHPLLTSSKLYFRVDTLKSQCTSGCPSLDIETQTQRRVIIYLGATSECLCKQRVMTTTSFRSLLRDL